jgi:hypothetical protein
MYTTYSDTWLVTVTVFLYNRSGWFCDGVIMRFLWSTNWIVIFHALQIPSLKGTAWYSGPPHEEDILSFASGQLCRHFTCAIEVPSSSRIISELCSQWEMWIQFFRGCVWKLSALQTKCIFHFCCVVYYFFGSGVKIIKLSFQKKNFSVREVLAKRDYWYFQSRISNTVMIFRPERKAGVSILSGWCVSFGAIIFLFDIHSFCSKQL